MAANPFGAHQVGDHMPTEWRIVTIGHDRYGVPVEINPARRFGAGTPAKITV